MAEDLGFHEKKKRDAIDEMDDWEVVEDKKKSKRDAIDELIDDN